MPRLSHSEMATELAHMVAIKAKWLADFSSGPNRRPDWNIKQQEKALAVLERAQADYRRAAQRVMNKENVS